MSVQRLIIYNIRSNFVQWLKVYNIPSMSLHWMVVCPIQSTIVHLSNTIKKMPDLQTNLSEIHAGWSTSRGQGCCGLWRIFTFKNKQSFSATHSQVFCLQKCTGSNDCQGIFCAKTRQGITRSSALDAGTPWLSKYCEDRTRTQCCTGRTSELESWWMGACDINQRNFWAFAQACAFHLVTRIFSWPSVWELCWYEYVSCTLSRYEYFSYANSRRPPI